MNLLNPNKQFSPPFLMQCITGFIYIDNQEFLFDIGSLRKTNKHHKREKKTCRTYIQRLNFPYYRR